MDKLAVSNIAWTGNDDEVFELLASNGVTGVEVAPGKVVGGWDGLNIKTMTAYRKQCESFGLKIPSFQAFLFGKSELQLLAEKNDFEKLAKHIDYVAALAEAAGAKVLVFGAPKNRLLLEHSAEYGFLLAKERLEVLAEICWKYGVSIGLEAVPEVYGGEIIRSYKESVDIVLSVNHPGLVFHLDTGCTFLNDDSISDAINDTIDMIKHFHISQPKLTDFSVPANYHTDAAKVLNKKNYKGWRCIEMLESTEPMRSIESALIFVKKYYLK